MKKRLYALLTALTMMLNGYTVSPFPGGATAFAMTASIFELPQNTVEELDDMQDNKNSAQVGGGVTFRSFLVEGRYAGLIESGVVYPDDSPRPANVIRTFNIDLDQLSFLTISDIIDAEQHKKVLGLLRGRILMQYPGAEVKPEDMDESWLSHAALGNDGLIVVLENYSFLRGVNEPPSFTIPYELLGDALILGDEEEDEPPSCDEDAQGPAVMLKCGTVDPSRPMVALTFDDGPSKYTPQLLDTLERHGARATFFVIGNLVESGKDTILRAIGLGCEITGHSWDHKDLTKLDEEQLRHQILSASDAVEQVTGEKPMFFRPPFGAVNERLKRVSRELGFAMVNWTVDPLDWKYRDADIVYEAIMREVADGYIILSHDLYGTTAQAMERVIPELIAQGYQLVTVSELLSHTHGSLEAGRVY